MNRLVNALLLGGLLVAPLLVSSCADDLPPPTEMGEIEVSVTLDGGPADQIYIRGYTGNAFGTLVYDTVFTNQTTLTNEPLGSFAAGTEFEILASARDVNGLTLGTTAVQFVVNQGVNHWDITIVVGGNQVAVDGAIDASVDTNTACSITSVSVSAPRLIPCAVGGPTSDITITITTENADNAAGCDTMAYGPQTVGGDPFVDTYPLTYDPGAFDFDGDLSADTIQIELLALDLESAAPQRWGGLSIVPITCVNGAALILAPTVHFMPIYVEGADNMGIGYYSEDGVTAIFAQLDGDADYPNTFMSIPSSIFGGRDFANAVNIGPEKWEIDLINQADQAPSRVAIDFNAVP